MTTSDIDYLSPIEDVIEDARKGRMFILVDDEDRENEGDLVMAAEKVTPDAVNFMAKHGRGLICLTLPRERVEQLGLSLMSPKNEARHQTAFTVSIEARDGVTTGISAADRAQTIAVAIDPKKGRGDIVTPGHIFPLIAQDGGVLVRAGHTEAAVDVARMAGLNPAGVICEIMNDDGTMARLPDLVKFAQLHGLKVASIADLIAYRRKSEKLIEKIEVVEMPTDYGEFKLHLYKSQLDGIHHVALVKGDIKGTEPTLVRVHSECLTGDIFASRRCDCGSQLHAAMEHIEKAGKGVIIYMRGHEGRGIGLHGKIMAYKLQEQGLDTVEANLKLGFPMDLRDYGIGAQIIYDLGVRKIRLMTNNPRKVIGLGGHKLEIVEQVPVKSHPKPENARYLETKKKKMGHKL